MERQLLESRYCFSLTKREMGKLRKMRGAIGVINKLDAMAAVKGITFKETDIFILIETEEGDNIIDHIESIIKEELI